MAVCDLGGGSTELAVGRPGAAPVWCTSLDVGSLRMTERYLHHDPPTRRQIEKARAAVRGQVSALAPGPPAPARALATGGTARALRKLVGETLGPDQLTAAVEISTRTSPRKLQRRFGVPRWRARVVPGGALVLVEIQALLGVPLEVAAGGLREGAVLRLLEHAALAA